MNGKLSFGIISRYGLHGRVYIEGRGELEGLWFFADTINFRAFHAQNPGCKGTNEIGNLLVFRGISADESWQGNDTDFAADLTLSRIAVLIDVLIFPLAPPPSMFRWRQPQPLLVEAAKNNDLTRIKELLEADADVNSSDAKGNTAILYSVLCGELEAVNILAAHGANPWQANQNDVYPMKLAQEQKKHHLLPALKIAEKQFQVASKIIDYLNVS